LDKPGRAGVCEQRNVCHVPELANRASGLLPLSGPFLNISFGYYTTVMDHEAAIRSQATRTLTLKHHIKLIKQNLVREPFTL
jgi:hypothetical protein